MPEPALMSWILGIPFLIGIADLVLTVRSLKHMPRPATGRGEWSQAVHVRP